VSEPRNIFVVGGGLAGMAAALALADQGQRVTLLEAKRNLGGRASSFYDGDTQQAIDFCQHVSLGCCTNLANFCQRAGIADQFERIRTLHFIGPNQEHCELTGSQRLPAPLHLLPVLWGLKYLSVWERFEIARSLRKLSRFPDNDILLDALSMRSWLEMERQSESAVNGFWKVILVSALSEELKNISVAVARKVFVDGFMATRESYEMLVPKLPLGELYGERLKTQLQARGVTVLSASGVREITGTRSGVTGIKLTDGSEFVVDGVVLATNWRTAASLLGPTIGPHLPELLEQEQLRTAPITGVHLWFDRPITALPHAVLVNRMSHWLFRPAFASDSATGQHYYQVVISASHTLADLTRDQIIAKVLGELDEVFPAMANAHLKRALVVTERHAVYSPGSGVMSRRPAQQTVVPNLFLAGDWTKTGWPATMEGAVRSGYLAAERVCDWLGHSQKFIVPDLPRGWLAWLLIK